MAIKERFGILGRLALHSYLTRFSVKNSFLCKAIPVSILWRFKGANNNNALNLEVPQSTFSLAGRLGEITTNTG